MPKQPDSSTIDQARPEGGLETGDAAAEVDEALPGLDETLDDELLRVEAYRLWNDAGQPKGRSDEFWYQAIANLSARAGK